MPAVLRALTIAIVLLLGAPALAARPSQRGTTQKRIALPHVRHIILDPGHGGENKGAVGHLGTREKVLTLELAQRFRDYLVAHTDAKVTLTREDDHAVALRERPRLANAQRGDVLISVHCNSNPDATVRGMEVWFLAADSSLDAGLEVVRREEGFDEDDPAPARRVGPEAILHAMRMAEAHERSQIFAHELARGLRSARTGMRFRGVRQARFGVLKEAEMPAVVFEVGYISHPEEGRHLLQAETQTALARGLLRGLVALDRQIAAMQPALAAGGPTQPAPPAAAGKRATTASTSATASRSSASPSAPPSKRSSAAPSGPRKVPQRRPAP